MTKAPEDYFDRVYEELKNRALRLMQHENAGHTLQPTALVHETFLRLHGKVPEFNDTSHFIATASVAMQRILVDWARRKLSLKRDVNLNQGIDISQLEQRVETPEEIFVVSELIDALEVNHPRRAELVRLRLLLGYSLQECAKQLNVSTSTAGDDWLFSKAWLAREYQRKSKTS